MAQPGITPKKLMEVLVLCVFAGIVLPMINAQMATIEGDAGNWSAGEILLAGAVSTFVLLALVYGIIKYVL